MSQVGKEFLSILNKNSGIFIFLIGASKLAKTILILSLRYIQISNIFLPFSFDYVAHTCQNQVFFNDALL